MLIIYLVNMQVFEYKDYKEYLNLRFDDKERGGGRGSRANLARYLGCQTSFVAQVLRGSTHFSFEQTEAINEFLSHSDEEAEYFFLIVHLARAGTEKLRRRISKKLERLREENLILSKRLKSTTSLGTEEKAVYYSNWYYAAIHALVSIPQLQTVDALSRNLSLSHVLIQHVLDFLVQCQLVRIKKGKYEIGVEKMHLPGDSPFIQRHHGNWRIQALRALEKIKPEDLHYSSVISLSRAELLEIREKIISLIQEKKKIIVASEKQEVGACFVLDLFEL